MTKIILTIDDQGQMTITAGDGGQQVPAKSIDEAMTMIKELATSATMPMEGGEEADPMAEGEPMMEDGQEEEAMMGNYRPGQTGR